MKEQNHNEENQPTLQGEEVWYLMPLGKELTYYRVDVTKGL